MFPLQEGEKITVVLPLTGEKRSFPADQYVFMATSMGTVKKTALDEFNNPRKAGIIAVDLDAGDYLIGASLTDGKHDVMLFSDGGKAVRFDENDVRPMGRNARGVRGMMLEDGQGVIAMLVAEDEQQSVLTATQNGYGKRTSITEYTRHGRGTKGMIAIQQSERNGKVVAATLVHVDDEIMLITDKGVLVRTRVSEIREMGRATQGVTLIGLDEGSQAERPAAHRRKRCHAGRHRYRKRPRHRRLQYRKQLMKKLITALAIASMACVTAVHAQTDAKTELAKKVVALQQGPELDRQMGPPAGGQRSQGQTGQGLGRSQRRTQEIRG
jgi:hypothetical protein